MIFSFRVIGQRSPARLVAGIRPRYTFPNLNRHSNHRLIFTLFRRSTTQDRRRDPDPVLTEDNLFHLFSVSPFAAVRARGDAIQSLAPCPVCASSHNHAHTQAQAQGVKFECPDCGWPTHCSEEHWKEDEEHQKYCSRLRESNEDEHDLRSGRRLREFELPGKLMTCSATVLE